jgi:hypothetical protein
MGNSRLIRAKRHAKKGWHKSMRITWRSRVLTLFKQGDEPRSRSTRNFECRRSINSCYTMERSRNKRSKRFDRRLDWTADEWFGN